MKATYDVHPDKKIHFGRFKDGVGRRLCDDSEQEAFTGEVSSDMIGCVDCIVKKVQMENELQQRAFFRSVLGNEEES